MKENYEYNNTHNNIIQKQNCRLKMGINCYFSLEGITLNENINNPQPISSSSPRVGLFSIGINSNVYIHQSFCKLTEDIFVNSPALCNGIVFFGHIWFENQSNNNNKIKFIDTYTGWNYSPSFLTIMRHHTID